jgi:hypothetical protein
MTTPGGYQLVKRRKVRLRRRRESEGQGIIMPVGTGGCVTGAPGNQPTEMLIRVFNESRIETGLDEKKFFSLADMVEKELYRKVSLPQAG